MKSPSGVRSRKPAAPAAPPMPLHTASTRSQRLGRKTQEPRKTKFVHWQEDDMWIGYLQDFPDYWTQGKSLVDLKDHLKDLYRDLTSGELHGIRKVDELVLP